MSLIYLLRYAPDASLGVRSETGALGALLRRIQVLGTVTDRGSSCHMPLRPCGALRVSRSGRTMGKSRTITGGNHVRCEVHRTVRPVLARLRGRDPPSGRAR